MTKQTSKKKLFRRGLALVLVGMTALTTVPMSSAVSPPIDQYVMGQPGVSALNIDTDDTDISTETSLVLGDVNSDGKINLEDAIMVQKYALSINDFTESHKLCADVNEDSNVNTLDAIYILKYSVSIPTEIKKFGAKWHESEYEYIEHPAETEEVLVTKESYKITEPLYEKSSRSICFACGADISGDKTAHALYHDKLGDFENFSYTSRDVWLYYGTDEWVVKNELVGEQKPYGFQGAEKARTSADMLIADMADSEEYEYGYRYFAGCAVCNEKLIEDIITVGFDDAANERVKNIFEEHKNQHIANGERSGGVAGYTTILFKTTTVPEESYYETRVIKDAWTEKVLVTVAGWY